MKLLLVAALTLVVACSARAAEKPWDRGDTALVIDAYEGNAIRWDEMASEPRIAAVIHRATIGSRKGARYRERQDEARRRGYAWGAFHVGMPGDPVAQADRFLDVARASDDDVLVLDIESLDARRGMTLASARRFLRHVHAKTGRWPMLYGNDDVVRKISRRAGRDAVFATTPLWYARFRDDISDFPTGTWDACALWQFCSEINCKAGDCPLRVPGTEHDIDVSLFAGTTDELRAAWPFSAGERP